MTNPKANNAIKWIGNLLLVAGFVGVGIWACSWLGLTFWQARDSRVFDENRANQTQLTTNRVAEGTVLGRLAIPRLHLEAMVREGDGEDTLSLALGHIPGTALPGQQGNTGIAGHRDTLFRGLKNIEANDRITIETHGASYAYRVQSIRVVKPQDVQVLDPGLSPELTLVTCYPFNYIGSAPDRFIVKARLITEKAPPPVEDIRFTVPQGHSKELIAGKVWLGVSATDTSRRTVDGWLWVMPERRTIWLRDVNTSQPVTFYQNGAKRQLVITSIAQASARGYLSPSPARS